MHVLVPWAACLSPACEAALPELDKLDQMGRLPHVRALLNSLTASTRYNGDEYALLVPHEILWAQAHGWSFPPDVAAPTVATAAWLARQSGLPGHAWGLITPCHWAMGHDSLTMLPPQDLQLSQADSHALFEAARPWFESEGWQLHWVSPLQWLAHHPSLADLPTASLDRVVGRNPDVWLPSDPRVRLVRRLQAEVQMLWYQHPVNAQREDQGLLSVNSFWLSGCGAWPDASNEPASATRLYVEEGLRTALMRMDIPAWLAAWESLDAGVLALAHQAMLQGCDVRFSLCGERHAVTLTAPAPVGTWQTLVQRFRRPPSTRLSALLQSL